MILLIDNYDSFVYNLARHFRRLGVETCVVRNDAITIQQVRSQKPRAIVLSPGPCTPREAGVSLSLVRELHAEIPMLGVCLGHQAIAEALGGQVVRGEPVHGSASLITHDGNRLFQGISCPLRVARYHSLTVDEITLPSSLIATAWTVDRIVMALAHRDYPVFGVQFHPESILTQDGYRLLANFLLIAGVKSSSNPTELAAGESRIQDNSTPLPKTVTPHAWRET